MSVVVQALNSTEALARAQSAHASGRLDAAEQDYRQCLSSVPATAAQAHHGLGWLLVQRGDGRAALAHFVAALQLVPGEPEYWISQLEALLLLGQDEAVHRLLPSALEARIDPSMVRGFEDRLRERRLDHLHERLTKLGVPAERAVHPPENALRRAREAFVARRNEEANRLSAEVLQKFPLSPLAWRIYGGSARLDLDANDAMRALRIAVDLDPENADVVINLATGLKALGRLPEAEAQLRALVEQQPQNTRALVTLGILLSGLNRSEAEVYLRRAVRSAPTEARAIIALGCHLRDGGSLEEAEHLLKKGLQQRPDDLNGAVALAACYVETGRHALAKGVLAPFDNDKIDNLQAMGIALFVSSHLDDVSPQQLFQMHQRLGRMIESDAPRLAPVTASSPERVLNVGFVSGDLRAHAVAHFFLPVWEKIDRKNFRLFAYSTSANVDAVTSRFQRSATGWCDASRMTDQALAERIRKDGIDILFDLSGHTALNRLGVFARKPAPLQVSWIGYPGTTGLAAMDYFLADIDFAPPGKLDDQFTEKLLLTRVSGTFTPEPSAPAVAEPPCQRKGSFTFGSFNRISKLTPETIRRWALVLQSVPNSRLCIGSTQGRERVQIKKQFSAHNIDATRIEFLPRMALADYLAAHAEVDLLLDTLPYSGGTTTCHGLWMGVPTLTLVGPTLAGRQGVSILARCGLQDFVTSSEEAFVERAAYWASQPDALETLRSTLRDRITASCLGDAEAVVTGLEDGLRAIWRRACSGRSPEAMVLPPRTGAEASLFV